MPLKIFGEFKKEINLFGQNDIQKGSNKTKPLHSEDKSSGKSYNNLNTEKEIDSRFKELKPIRSQARKEYIKSTNILENHPPELEYCNEAGLLSHMKIYNKKKAERLIITKEGCSWEEYTNWQHLKIPTFSIYNK
ncbi:hypothetical protein O181_004278 [Austropuccinia psidii MF-1]|uniref:Uncharacterized protein n=1 Tax=Austropuccinia psidii MF-1 TaxID=1389203 RepID=A0A9Q3BG98_9BASI|nr:hypothetical protein [Austropuccinia psidii MF-1]